jgi:hypothetical protein
MKLYLYYHITLYDFTDHIVFYDFTDYITLYNFTDHITLYDLYFLQNEF